jgi:hypothetical protein
MKKINLTAVVVRPDLFSEAKPINVAKDLGNLIHFNAQDIDVMRFGDRLFDSEGEIEVSDAELDIIRKHVPMLKAWAQLPILEILNISK